MYVSENAEALRVFSYSIYIFARREYQLPYSLGLIVCTAPKKVMNVLQRAANHSVTRVTPSHIRCV